MKKCPRCGVGNDDTYKVCTICGGPLPDNNESSSPDNTGYQSGYSSNNSSFNNSSYPNYPRYSEKSSNAGTYSIIFGILSIFCCAFIFGPLAIIKANEDPYSDLGKIGRILGIVGIALQVIAMFLRLIKRI